MAQQRHSGQDTESISAPISDAIQTQQRSHIYELLALIFGREPSVDLLRHLEVPQLQRELQNLGASFQGALWKQPIEKRVSELEVEYTRLFIGPGSHIALQESVAQGEGQYWGDRTCAAVKTYADHGYQVDPKWKDLPDHLSVELQFMGTLIQREAQSGAKGQQKEIAKLQGAQKAFLEGHLVPWVPQIVSQLQEEARWDFYRGFGALLKEWTEEEQIYLSGKCHRT